MTMPPLDPQGKRRPTSDDLAGIPVRIEEEEDRALRPRQMPDQPQMPESHSPSQLTPDNLAGIAVCIEGEEDVTIRPRPPKASPSQTTSRPDKQAS